MEKIDRCPHCGSTLGIYLKYNYIGVQYRQGFNGEEQDNGSMYDTATVNTGKTVYCQNCDKKICHVNKLLKQWGEIK